MRYYAGIGSRSTPPDALQLMERCAAFLNAVGFTLRSGGAEGADKAFERGCGDGSKEIFLPSQPVCLESLVLASCIHPAWNNVGSYGKKCHARNCYQILGKDLKTPVDFVICWTPGSQPIGGTRTAIVLAKNNDIPVYNLASDLDVSNLKLLFSKLEQEYQTAGGLSLIKVFP